MSESMTVEQARADFETWISNPPFEYSTARFGNGEYVYATVGFAWKAWQAAQAKMQARVAELESEKWNAQIAEGALASVEQERDKWQEIANRWLAVSNDQALVIDALKQERDDLLSRLPEGMKRCTIQFRECEKGHGWLTASNWVQHECATCERDELRRRVAELESGQARIKAEAVRECWNKIDSMIARGFLQGTGDDKTAERNGIISAANAIMEMLANQIEGGE